MLESARGFFFLSDWRSAFVVKPVYAGLLVDPRCKPLADREPILLWILLHFLLVCMEIAQGGLLPHMCVSPLCGSDLCSSQLHTKPYEADDNPGNQQSVSKCMSHKEGSCDAERWSRVKHHKQWLTSAPQPPSTLTAESVSSHHITHPTESKLAWGFSLHSCLIVCLFFLHRGLDFMEMNSRKKSRLISGLKKWCNKKLKLPTSS